MAKKENKGCLLTNEELEKELARKGLDREGAHSYVGLQDTGDRTVRPLGTDVQRRDGLAPEDLDEGGQKDKGNRSNRLAKYSVNKKPVFW